MEVEAFQECWKEESLTFVEEEFYESIQAPRWIDFTLPVLQEPLIDDNAWFCVRAGCDQKHGTLLDQTLNHSYSLKSQASKSVGFISKSPTMEGKSSVRPRLRVQLSTPTSKGKDRTPGKGKPPVMSASKLRQKQCEENEDPNSTNIGTLNFKMDVSGAEGFLSPKPSSNADGLDNLEKNPPDILTGKQVVAASDVNLTPQNQSIKVTTAFSTPRIKKNHSVKREPFRSNPALSKGMNTAARSKAVAPRRILFETPTKSVKKTPSKDLTPVTKHFSNSKKHVQFAANDNKYSSPAKLTPRVCFTSCSVQPSVSPLLRVHDFPSSSRPKDSRKVINNPPSSHRKVLVSDQSNDKESLMRANVQEMDLVQGKVGSTHKYGGWSDNQSSIKQSHSGNDDERNPGDSKEKNSKGIMKRESGMEEPYAGQLASIISGERLTYGISEIQSHKASESYGAEESTSNPDEANGVEQYFEGLKKDRENKKKGHPDGKVEIAILEVGENDNQNKFDVEAEDSNLERRDNETQMNSAAENRVAGEMPLIKNWFPSELASNLQNDSDGKNEIEILKDRKNGDESIEFVKPIYGSQQETENNDGSASESVFSGRNMRVTKTTVLKSEFDVKHNEQNLEGKANKFVMYSAAENKGSDAENAIIIWMGSESESKLEVDSDGRDETTILEDGKHDGQDALDVRHNDNNLKEGETKVVMNSGPENVKVGEVLTISDCVNTRAVLETGIEVEPSKVESQDRNVGKRDDFYPKNKQNSKENGDRVIFDQHVIRGSKEGKAGEAIQLESDLEFQSKIFQKDISSDSGECLEVTVNVAVKYVKEDNRDSMQKISTDNSAAENGANAGLSWPNSGCNASQYLSQALKDDAKILLKSAIEPESKQCNELTDHTVEVDSSDSRTSLSEVNHQSHLAGNEMIKSDVWGHAHCLETFEEHHHGELNCLQSKGIDGGLDCDEYSIIPQSKSDSSILFVSDSLNNEVICQLPRDCDEVTQIAELKKNEEIRLPDRDCLPHSKSDGAVEVLAVAGCDVKKEILSTPSKGEKRTSGEMNSKINCSNGEVCQDESCCMAFSSTCQSALPTKVNGTSIPRAFNHKKIKPTLPRPFRLRTAERGERKEMGLNKKAQLAEENETSPMREIRANKAQGTHSHIDPSKRGKSETPKPHEGKAKSRPRHIEDVMPKMLEDKGEEIKSTPDEPLHHRPVVKMPNFWKPPFKPMRSTKKLTTPKEPNFHPMHSKKHCTKGVESSDRAVL